MVTTYSVIIQTKQTAEEHAVYRPLFAESIRNGLVGFCPWICEANTIDDALPKLRELTDDKREWNAVIVLSENDITRLGSASNVQNPYDFTLFNEPEEEIEISRNPLVFLLHMLGGMPAPEKQFQSVIVQEEGKKPHIVYELVKEDDKTDAYRKISEELSYDGIRPTNIFLITLRHSWSDRYDISHSWNNWLESMSSEFWKRNRYPSNCRFLVYDIADEGPIRREEDLLKFWIIVVLLAVNDLDAASIQAYRLYLTNILTDDAAIEDAFQQTVNRLSSIKASLKKTIRNELEGSEISKNPLPDYRLDIPIVFELPDSSLRRIKTRIFSLVSSGRGADVSKWDKARKDTESSLEASIRVADRALDQTANRMKSSYTFDRDHVYRLDQYQKEDLLLETDQLYRDVIELQGELPTDKVAASKEVRAISDSIRCFLKQRVSWRQAGITMLFCAVAVFLSVMPGIGLGVKAGHIDVSVVTVGILNYLLVIVVCGLAMLIAQKIKLKRRIGKYNEVIRDAFNRIESNAKEYSEYMSAVASHSRGLSFLDISNQKDMEVAGIQEMRLKHIDAIDMMISRLSGWANAFHLNVEFEKPEIYEGIQIDVMNPPPENPAYSIERGFNYEVPLGDTGMHIDSPFSFVKEFDLIREELYEDVNR